MTTLLTDAQKLKQNLEQDHIRIIDVRSHEDYTRSHIPGAIHFEIAELNARQAGDPYPTVGLLPTVENFNTAVATAGIDEEHTVIVYDDTAGPSAARFAWTLKAFGHNKVSMLNGGFQSWLSHGYTVNTAIPKVKVSPGSFHGTLQNDRVADRNYILGQLENDSVKIIDARSEAEFDGNDIRANQGGHIPGAININWTKTKATDETNEFKSLIALQQLFESQGITTDKEVICYCQSHQRSSVLCVLLEELGYKNVKGYPGAWSDWGNQPDTPIEK